MEKGVLSFDSGEFLNRAKTIVYNWTKENSQTTEKFEVRTTWFSKTADNWKAILCTSLPDTLLFEVTYKASKGETYLDVYNKIEHRIFKDGTV